MWTALAWIVTVVFGYYAVRVAVCDLLWAWWFLRGQHGSSPVLGLGGVLALFAAAASPEPWLSGVVLGVWVLEGLLLLIALAIAGIDWLRRRR